MDQEQEQSSRIDAYSHMGMPSLFLSTKLSEGDVSPSGNQGPREASLLDAAPYMLQVLE